MVNNSVNPMTGEVKLDQTAADDVEVTCDTDWSKEKIILQRDIGLTSAIGLIISSIIGSGIFMAPVAIVKQCHSIGLSLTVWVISGLVSILKSMCFVELGLLFPRAGGEYAYIREINGETMGFLNAYVTMFAARPCSIAIVSKMTIYYFMDAFLPGCELHPMLNKIMGAWLILTIVAINSLSTKNIMIVQTAMSAMKLAALALIIVTGAVHMLKGNTENFATPFKESTTSFINVAVAIYAGVYSYDGWQGIYDVMEDIKKPERIAPLASTISILTIIVLYVGTNIAYFSTMTPDEMARSSAVAMSFARVTMGSFSRVIPLLVGISTVGALNSSIITASRNLFAQGRDGVFPKVLCMLSVKYKVPWVASWFICFISIVYIFAYSIFELFNYLNFTSFFFNIFLYGNVIILRYTRPNLPRPFKCNLLVPAMVVTMVIVMAVAGAIQSPFNFMVSQIQVLCGLPLYAMVVYCNSHPRFIYDFKYKFNSNLQKLLMIVPPENEKI